MELGCWTENSLQTSFIKLNMVGRPTTATLNKNRALARTRQTRLESRRRPPIAAPPLHPDPIDNQDADNESSGDEIECTRWSGGIAHYVSDEGTIVVSDDDSEEVVEELSGSELEEVIQHHRERVVVSAPTVEQPMAESSALSVIMRTWTKREWKKVEMTWLLGYSGRSVHTKRHRAQVARDKEKEDAMLRNG